MKRTLFATLMLLAAGVAGAEERVLVLDPSQTEVTFDLPATGHDVHGVFALRAGQIRFDPETGAAQGAVEVDLAAGKTGNDSRDKTMRKDVLEAERYPFARFAVREVKGELRDSGDSRLTLVGVLDLHGTQHPLEVAAQVHREGGRILADVDFPVPFVEWGMDDPSILFLRVDKTVSVKVHAVGTLSAAAAEIAAGG